MESTGILFNVKSGTFCWDSCRELPMKKGELVLSMGADRIINSVRVIDILRDGRMMSCLFDDLRPVKKQHRSQRRQHE